MLHRDGEFEEWNLAAHARKYIPLYLKKKDDKVVYIPYRDVPSDSVKYVKYVYEEAIGWVYLGTSQYS